MDHKRPENRDRHLFMGLLIIYALSWAQHDLQQRCEQQKS